MNKQYQELSKLFIDTRKLMGISQQQLADILNVGQPNICSIESGKSDTKGTTVLKMIRFKKLAKD